MKATFAVTDPNWLARLAPAVSEANFWQPRPTRVSQPAGTPWVFKVRGQDRLGGFGFFSYWTEMPLAIAWETFGNANGVTSYAEMWRRVTDLRHGGNREDRVGCVVLSDVVVLAEADRPRAPSGWRPQTVRMAGFDIASGEGAAIWDRLRFLDPCARQSAYSPLLEAPGGYLTPKLVAHRRGQGAFRLMVTDAYDRRCAVSGERTLPVLEAAHIRPYAEHESHDVRNGILLRSDIHRLYDAGLVTVEPDLTFRVSRVIDRDYSNGKIYYALDGKTIRIPARPDARPDPAALADHAKRFFRG